VGQKIEVAMQEALLGFMVSSFHEHFTKQKVGGGAPARVADGYFTLRVPEMSDGTWRELAATMDREDLQDDPRFATAEGRRAHRKELDDIVFVWAGGQTRQELWVKLRDLGYFGAPVLSMGEVIEDPHVKAREAFIQREHPTAGPLTLLAPWIRMSETPTAIQQVSPTVGQHTDEVLSGLLGLSSDAISELRAQNAIA
jgi:crotonobetainyl-CoA:carnitine CoA-transferase CaiB-like acyl-CoA transferase